MTDPTSAAEVREMLAEIIMLGRIDNHTSGRIAADILAHPTLGHRLLGQQGGDAGEAAGVYVDYIHGPFFRPDFVEHIVKAFCRGWEPEGFRWVDGQIAAAQEQWSALRRALRASVDHYLDLLAAAGKPPLATAPSPAQAGQREETVGSLFEKAWTAPVQAGSAAPTDGGAHE